MSQREQQGSVEGRASVTPADRALAASMLQRLRAGEDLREAMIRRVRRAIAAQDYENPLKLEIAADRMTDELKP